MTLGVVVECHVVAHQICLGKFYHQYEAIYTIRISLGTELKILNLRNKPTLSMWSGEKSSHRILQNRAANIATKL